jgi:hypothetical protein
MQKYWSNQSLNLTLALNQEGHLTTKVLDYKQIRSKKSIISKTAVSTSEGHNKRDDIN